MENASYGFMVPKVPNKTDSSKAHTTSTPCHDKQSSLPSQVTSSMHEYFLNGSEINSSHNAKSAPILGSNMNINNLSNSESLNYQKVRKLISETAENTEKLIREKENILQHLNSIDLSKYSFPNEKKPRTDYTYAKSSSYLTECKELANDNVVMPNLCRRARRSPQNSLNQTNPDESSGVCGKIKTFLNRSTDEKPTNKSVQIEQVDVRLEKTPSISTTTTTTTISRAQGRTKTPTKCCSFKIPLFFILLAPFLLYGLNKLDKKENLYHNINHNYLHKYLGLKVDQHTLDLYRDQMDHVSDRVERFFTNYIPQAFYLVKNKTSMIKDTIIEYKDATIGGFDLASNFFKNEDLVQSLEAIKKKIFDETLSTLKDTKTNDAQIRQEFDQIFNYTLTIMTNKLADHLVQSKQSYETELGQVKQMLSDLDTRYQKLLSQMHQSKPSGGDKSMEDMVTFKKIEEYINKTFYLYNADKTGMTDFASESVGGSILFTKCTEDYVDNSRWITVLNVPITRLSVSPRVVIQGSMQPGNCWAFKGAKADLFIKLAARIRPSSFSLEHIPKELSLTGLIDSAPQNFSVYGYESKDLINDHARLLLGNYRYDNESQNTLQFFSVQHQHDKAISVVELKIETNSGNKEFTCLYKFRVHGKLFKLVKDSVEEQAASHPKDLPIQDEKKSE
ncbi:SUN domain-containing 1 isoform X2, partial [Brachionus plicatilis]